jgi:hypothetical protein
MLKMRILTFMVTTAPFALLVVRLALGTKTGGSSDGGHWA